MLVRRNSFLDEILERGFDNYSEERMITPLSNIKENEKGFDISVAIPGVKKENIEIDINDDTLIVSSKIEKKKKKIEENYSVKEYEFHNFKKVFSLPKDIVDKKKISAKYENGELLLNIPKKMKIDKAPMKIKVA